MRSAPRFLALDMTSVAGLLNIRTSSTRPDDAAEWCAPWTFGVEMWAVSNRPKAVSEAESRRARPPRIASANHWKPQTPASASDVEHQALPLQSAMPNLDMLLLGQRRGEEGLNDLRYTILTQGIPANSEGMVSRYH